MATPSDEMKTKLTWRRFEDGKHTWDDLTEKIFVEEVELAIVSHPAVADVLVCGRPSERRRLLTKIR